MPFTPFHMGPGMAMKALAGPRLSLVSFGLAQVMMDIEPLVHMIRGDRGHHGLIHSYLGATLVGLATLPVARPLTRGLLRPWNDALRDGGLEWLVEPSSGEWLPVVLGTFAGTYSHVVLDSIMHADMTPLAPFSQSNAMLDSLSYAGIHIACVLSGMVGLGAWAIVQRIRAARRDPSA
jgi:membrane-bound metal-dependent hydrolase YbcI (DUF457 family)